MGLIVSLLSIPLIKRLIDIHRRIDGKWFRYLRSLLYLRNRRKQNKTNRVVTHDFMKDDVRDLGILPFEHEWQYDGPNKHKSEDLLIYGVNSSKQSFKIEIKWRTDSNPIKAKIDLRFDDNDGNTYTLEEESDVQYRNHREYKVSGLGIEILSPFRRKRIRFRGYLTKNGNQLVYVKFRFLWIGMSRVYDFTHDFDDQFMTDEWVKSKNGMTEPPFEDRIEQFGQMKGTFEEENNSQRILYFWGAISKKFLSTKPLNRRIIRIIGYNKKGIGFNLGFLSNKNGFEYRFGFVFDRFILKRLTHIKLNKDNFEDLLRSPNIAFKAQFGDKEYEFLITKNENSVANNLVVNGYEGMCYVLEENENEYQKTSIPETKRVSDMSLVLAMNEDNCRLVELSGGKGSSLAELMALSKQMSGEENKFNVANGIVVTTNAYKRLLEENKDLREDINELEKSTNISKEELKKKCQNLVDSVANHKLPEIIKQDIELNLKKVFNDYENRLFAVRSSGASEDSEDMSAAGQMTTFLGVKGLDDIYESVMKCWSSQFSHIAVEYKRGYGQLINSPMAVVIQEMVNCDSAGVMFTCDPITGDERLIEITANYGLGESVVSASAEPDTIRLSVDITSNSLSKKRSIRGIESKTIGAKKTLIKLDSNGGTFEEMVNDKDNCCISDELIVRLGDLGLRVHKHYGNARDIEWGVKDGHIFMLQSRPVTNLDNSYTDYEIMHEMDTPHQTEFEIYSRAHWGENFPGASSWMVYTYMMGNKGIWHRNISKMMGSVSDDIYNPYRPGMGVHYNQFMFNMTDSTMIFSKMFAGYPNNPQAKQSVMSFFGHDIDDEDVLNVFKENGNEAKSLSLFAKITMMFKMPLTILRGPANLIKDVNSFMHQNRYSMIDQIKHAKTAKQIFNAVVDEHLRISGVTLRNHGPVSMGSNIKTMLLRKALEGAQANNPYLEEDFNLMISSCNDVISAEVPNSLREVARSIVDKERFSQLSDEEAFKELKNGSDEASKKFKAFLDKHGHRGYREMDPLYLMWRDDPLPCIKTIKGLLTGKESLFELKVEKSVDQVMSELKTPLSYTRKQLIRKLLLPMCRSGVGYRELSKYFLIFINNEVRYGLRHLAKALVDEGYIPDVNYMFFLTIEEVDRLCNGERDPLIHMRARLRKRVYPKMNKYKFEEFIKGPEMKPRNAEESIVPTNLADGAVQMTGTPVSLGCIKARVCVAEDITDADAIQPGDILITYSTDIGWSPYFPLLSGIITEIGGTISHGAVIAREYGIPSLIAVEGACRAFKTGDICVLDTTSRTITKVE